MADATEKSVDRPRVVVWRSSVLAGSETFIRNQFDATPGTVALMGLTRTSSALSRLDDVIVFDTRSRERINYRLFRITRRSRRACKLVRDLGADAIHVHFVPDAWQILPLARRLGIPLIVTTHGFDVTSWPAQPGLRGYVARRKLRTVMREAAQVLAVSEPIRDRVVALGADLRLVGMHHIGVAIPDAVRKSEPRWDVLFVGRFAEKKGLPDLLEALAIAGREIPIAAVIIGDGASRPALEQKAQALKLDVTFAGSLPPQEVSRELSRARLVLVPSHQAPDGDAEGLPTVVMEASLHGVPVVGYAHSGIPEAVESGRTGILVAERDVSSLASHIVRLLRDDETRLAMGERARAKMLNEFDLVTQSVELGHIYQRVVNSNQRG